MTIPDVTIAAVGDLQLGDSSVCVGFGLRSRYPEVRPLFESTRSEWSEADLVFGNLETTLSTVGLDPMDWRLAQMRGIPSYARELREAGFTVLNVANNHAVQHGIDTFEATVSLLRDAGIAPCGIKGTGEWNSEPVMITTRSGVRLGLLGYCLRPRQYASEAPPFAEGLAPEICADVARLRSRVDHVLVSLHWGEEFVPHPSAAEVAIARAVVDAGAVLVLGHHPHVLRPVERYRGGLIAYSLGNFAADMTWYEPLRTGAILACQLGSDGVRSGRLVRTRFGDDFVPHSVSDRAETAFADRLVGIADEEYRMAIARTINAQRYRSYLFALRNARRFRRGMLKQLMLTTLGNKLALPRLTRGRSP